MFTSWKQLIKASLSQSVLPLLYQELMIRVMSLLSPRMFFSLHNAIWHEMRIQTWMTFFMRIQSPSMKSMPSVLSAVVQQENLDRRFCLQIKSRTKIQSTQKQFWNSVYILKKKNLTGCTYGEKIKQLTFFFASVPFHWSCVIRWVSECEDKVITSHPCRPNAANATDCWAPLPPAHPQTDPPSISCGPFVCSMKNMRSLPMTGSYFIYISAEFLLVHRDIYAWNYSGTVLGIAMHRKC